jgi:hypothetical protein
MGLNRACASTTTRARRSRTNSAMSWLASPDAGFLYVARGEALPGGNCPHFTLTDTASPAMTLAGACAQVLHDTQRQHGEEVMWHLALQLAADPGRAFAMIHATAGHDASSPQLRGLDWDELGRLVRSTLLVCATAVDDIAAAAQAMVDSGQDAFVVDKDDLAAIGEAVAARLDEVTRVTFTDWTVERLAALTPLTGLAAAVQPVDELPPELQRGVEQARAALLREAVPLPPEVEAVIAYASEEDQERLRREVAAYRARQARDNDLRPR